MSETFEPTDERKRRGHYIPPEIGRDVNRPYGRFADTWEMMANKGLISEEEERAGKEFTLYWHGALRVPAGISSYGEQRWNGTPVGQLSASGMLGPEWRETCRRRLDECRDWINHDLQWDTLVYIAQTNGTAEQAGYMLGKQSKSRATEEGRKQLLAALDKLVRLWYKAR